MAHQDPDWFEREYFPSLIVPNAGQIFQEWKDRSAATRAKLKFRSDLRYGPHSREVLDFYPATNPQTRVAFLPYGPKSLKTLKPVTYERTPQTLGEYLKKRRAELCLFQRDLRKRFKLEKETYANWEKDRCYPAMKHWPGIIAFLGFDPSPAPSTIGEQLLAYRRRHGLSRKTLAADLAVDDGLPDILYQTQ